MESIEVGPSNYDKTESRYPGIDQVLSNLLSSEDKNIQESTREYLEILKQRLNLSESSLSSDKDEYTQLLYAVAERYDSSDQVESYLYSIADMARSANHDNDSYRYVAIALINEICDVVDARVSDSQSTISSNREQLDLQTEIPLNGYYSRMMQDPANKRLVGALLWHANVSVDSVSQLSPQDGLKKLYKIAQNTEGLDGIITTMLRAQSIQDIDRVPELKQAIENVKMGLEIYPYEQQFSVINNLLIGKRIGTVIRLLMDNYLSQSQEYSVSASMMNDPDIGMMFESIRTESELEEAIHKCISGRIKSEAVPVDAPFTQDYADQNKQKQYIEETKYPILEAYRRYRAILDSL